MLGGADLRFARDILTRYYRVANLRLPKDLALREFAFQTLDQGVYVRHLSFTSEAELRGYLVLNTPRQAYYSTAKYSNPAAQSYEDSGWMGSEIMFDIDADKLPGCTTRVLGDGVELVSEECLSLAREALGRLVYVLLEHMGFAKEELLIYFSGSRGFHVVVVTEDPEWLTLRQVHRLEIAEYLSARSLDLDRLLKRAVRVGRSSITPAPPTERDGGWRSLVARFHGGQEVGEGVIQRIAVPVDPLVTQDLSRLIRIPNSVNGKSGLVARPVDPDRVGDFDVGEAKVFEGYAIVVPRVSFEGSIYGTRVRLSEGERTRVDLQTALYLVLNDLASVVRYGIDRVRT